jgi:dCMP deaminase
VVRAIHELPLSPIPCLDSLLGALNRRETRRARIRKPSGFPTSANRYPLSPIPYPMYDISSRPTWDEYFMMLAKLTATRSTCLAFPVGSVIVKDRQVLSTGYNGSPSGSVHCTTQGYCYPELSACNASKILPSRSVHAEANAIAQAAKHGISTGGASIYVTLEPCLSCLKLIISAGIREVFYETTFNSGDNLKVRDFLLQDSSIELIPIQVSEATAKRSAAFLLNPTSVESFSE